MRQPNKNEKEKKTQNVSMLFDDALPTSLKYEGIVPQSKQGLNLHTNQEAPLSPYIIHLSHKEPVTQNTPRLNALANSLIIDPDLLLEDDVPESTLNCEDELALSFDEIASQLREPDFHVASKTKKIINTRNSVSKITTTVAPVTIPLDVAKVNLQKELTEVELTEITKDELTSLCENLAEIETIPENVPFDTGKGYLIHKEVSEITEVEDIEIMFAETPSRASFFGLLPFLGQVRFRAITAFVLLSFAIVIPLQAMKSFSGITDKQAEITDAGLAAIDNFARGTKALEADRFDVAQSNFKRASQDFQSAEESLTSMNLAVQGLIQIIPTTDKAYDTAKGLVDAGQSFSQAAIELSNAANAIQSKEAVTIVTKLQILKTYIENALPEVESAVVSLEKVHPSLLPAEHQATVEELKTQAPKIAESMHEFIKFADTLSVILGDEQKMRYLITFQNNTELRPTGGFIGSFAEMDLWRGEITNIHIPKGGTYDLQGQLTDFVEAPGPLQLINPRWEFHDSNWFPDFAQSAKKLMQFYENAGEPSVDGVIAINASMVPALLEIIGPIDMPDYNRTIDSENFLFETQKIVDIEYGEFDKTGEERTEDAPKQFIGDLAPILLERMQDADMKQMLAIADVIGDGLVEKDIQIYLENNSLQTQMEELGWSGTIKQTPGDYLMIVNTNLGGGKTDSVIDQRVDVDIEIAEDGTITNKVVITKEHKGLKSAIFEGKNNVDYIRLYVPKGAKLISSSGFEIPPAELFDKPEIELTQDTDLALLNSTKTKDPVSQTDIWEESGKTVFGNWMQTAPGETETVTFTYELPFKFKVAKTETTLLDVAKSKLGFKDLETYTLFVQKQSGVKSRVTSINISFPTRSDLVWSSHVGTSEGKNILVTNARDTFLRFLIENHIE